MYDTEPGWEWAEDALKHRHETETMKLNDVYTGGGNHLKAADLAQDVKVTIAGYEIVEFDEKSQDGRPYVAKKAVVSFQGKDKTLVLNKTNASIIGEMHGDDLDAWKGKEITIGPDRTDFGGRMVPCIRVRYQQQAPAQTGGDAGGGPSDDMPFNAYAKGAEYTV